MQGCISYHELCVLIHFTVNAEPHYIDQASSHHHPQHHHQQQQQQQLHHQRQRRPSFEIKRESDAEPDSEPLSAPGTELIYL